MKCWNHNRKTTKRTNRTNELMASTPNSPHDFPPRARVFEHNRKHENMSMFSPYLTHRPSMSPRVQRHALGSSTLVPCGSHAPFAGRDRHAIVNNGIECAVGDSATKNFPVNYCVALPAPPSSLPPPHLPHDDGITNNSTDRLLLRLFVRRTAPVSAASPWLGR